MGATEGDILWEIGLGGRDISYYLYFQNNTRIQKIVDHKLDHVDNFP